MRLARIAGIVVVLMGIAALGIVLAPAVYGQAGRDRVDVQVTPRPVPRLEVFGAGSSIGVTVEELAQSDVSKHKLSSASGALIDSVREGTPAAKAGLKPGDVVTEFDGERVRSASQFGRLVRETPAGRTVRITVVRDGQKSTLDVTPESRDVWSSNLNFDFAPDIASIVGDKIGDAMSRAGRSLEWRLADRDFPGVFMSQMGRGRLGVTLQELTPQLADYFGTKDGVLVTSVREGTPAASAGLKAGDVITAIGSRTVNDVSDVTSAVRNADGEISIRVIRDKKELTLKTKLEPAERRSRRAFRMEY